MGSRRPRRQVDRGVNRRLVWGVRTGFRQVVCLPPGVGKLPLLDAPSVLPGASQRRLTPDHRPLIGPRPFLRDGRPDFPTKHYADVSPTFGAVRVCSREWVVAIEGCGELSHCTHVRVRFTNGPRPPLPFPTTDVPATEMPPLLPIAILTLSSATVSIQTSRQQSTHK